ncbi:hypothetical protein D3C86_1739100 [compost metagenome]
MRDRESVAGILMAEKGIEIVETGPGDGGHAHGAGFMGRKKNQVLGVQLLAQLVKPLQRVHFAMPKRVFQLVIGLRYHQRQIGVA